MAFSRKQTVARSKSAFAFLVFLAAIAPFLTVASLYVPVWHHYRIAFPHLSSSDLVRWRDYFQNYKETIREVNAYRAMGVHGVIVGQEARDLADAALSSGSIIAPETGLAISIPFDDTDMSPERLDDLGMAGLLVSDIFLEAYKNSGDSRFLLAARDYALSFIFAERAIWMPRGLLWNDHAIALRTALLGRLLAALERDQSGSATDELVIMQEIDGLVQLLSRSSHYTFATNHGLMQNVAVLGAALVVPDLPAVKANLEDVLSRAVNQIEFLAMNDGVFTEHSIGYQEFDLNLLAVLERFMSLQNRAVPRSLAERYERGLQFYRHVSRPDGTVPRHGDTIGTANPIYQPSLENGALERKPVVPNALQELSSVLLKENSGYWSQWFQGEHTLASWANFESNSHKHADELSVIFWSAGTEWWTASGYWPYGDPLRMPAIGWRSSNAPHQVGESFDSVRKSHLEASYSNDDLVILQIGRGLENGDYSVDRVIIGTREGVWLVVDIGRSVGNLGSESVWQTVPTTRVEVGSGPRNFKIFAEDSDSVLSGSVIGSSDLDIEWVSGSRDPYGGWVSTGSAYEQAPALILSTPSGQWSGLLWQVGGSEQSVIDAISAQLDWVSEFEWTLKIESGIADLLFARNGSRFGYTTPFESKDVLLNMPGQLELRSQAESAYAKVAQTVPAYRDYLPWRKKVMVVGLAGAVVQLLALVGWSVGISRTRFDLALLAAVLFMHISLASWLHLSYFAPP